MVQHTLVVLKSLMYFLDVLYVEMRRNVLVVAKRTTSNSSSGIPYTVIILAHDVDVLVDRSYTVRVVLC